MLHETLSYRRATVDDLRSICELGQVLNRLHHEAWPRVFAPDPHTAAAEMHWMKCLQGDAAATFLACAGDLPVGFVTIQVLEENHCLLQPVRFARVGSLCVARQLRGRGIGRALMGYAEQWALTCGAVDIRLDVWEFNTSARCLYEELGYETRSVAMSKPLTPKGA